MDPLIALSTVPAARASRSIVGHGPLAGARRQRATAQKLAAAWRLLSGHASQDGRLCPHAHKSRPIGGGGSICWSRPTAVVMATRIPVHGIPVHGALAGRAIRRVIRSLIDATLAGVVLLLPSCRPTTTAPRWANTSRSTTGRPLNRLRKSLPLTDNQGMALVNTRGIEPLHSGAQITQRTKSDSCCSRRASATEGASVWSLGVNRGKATDRLTWFRPRPPILSKP